MIVTAGKSGLPGYKLTDRGIKLLLKGEDV